MIRIDFIHLEGGFALKGERSFCIKMWCKQSVDIAVRIRSFFLVSSCQ